MTVTESRPETDAESAASETVDPFDSSGFAGALATGDHKVLGKLYLFFGLAGGLFALVLQLFVALERVDISGVDILTFGSDNQFFQTWSLARVSLLFFCVVPLLLGLATYVVPLQVGAPSIAFPRAAAASFWAWLVGMGIHVTTVIVDGGLGYPLNPVAAVQGPEPEAIELSILSIALVVVAILLASICVMATIIAERPMGMSLYEVPLFSWSMLVAGGIWLLSLPVWLANLAIGWIDFRGEDAVRFGDVSTMWDQLAWMWSQPMIFAFAIPVLGIVGEILPVASGTGQRMYGVVQTSIAAFGVLTFGAWAQPLFNETVDQEVLFVSVSLLLLVPALVFAGGVINTLMSGKVTFSGQLVLALLALAALLAGAAAAALRVLGPAVGVVREFDSDWLADVIRPLEDLQGTVIVTGIMQHALGAALIAAVAGLYYWGPKMFGRQLNGSIGALAGLAMAAGVLLSGVSNIITGFLDEGEQVYQPGAYDQVWDSSAVEAMNVLGLIGSILVLGGITLVVLDVLISVLFKRGDAEGAANPWNGHTLEWATTSPPPLGNFEEAPVVHSPTPLLDRHEEADA